MSDDTAVRVLAELGQAAGDVGYAVRAAEAAHAAGAWGVKIQVLDPVRIAAADSPKYWATQAGDDSSQRAVFARNGVLDRGQVWEIAAECRRIGVAFTGTPFDPDAVLTLVEAGAVALKIASGDIVYRRLLDAVAETRLPVILSTGASTDMEVQRARLRLADRGTTDLTVLACGLVYPCPDDQAQLRRISYLRSTHGRKVGYSDHTLGTRTAVAAAALGAVLLEKHFSLSRDGGSPDDEMALLPDQLADYVRNADLGRQLAGQHGFAVTDAEQPARVGARRAVRWARDLEPGHVIGPDDIVEQRPWAEGLTAWFADHALGGTILQPVKAGGVVDADRRGAWRPRQDDPYAQVETALSARR